ncbi:MAG: hypothetical protein A2Z90_13885 [Burkholderiales bacterium GWA2_64_37]|nr:MAG: hypothetical protein A2Z90_13885 [Burkholderiales bacterium GWA2_64_37]
MAFSYPQELVQQQRCLLATEKNILHRGFQNLCPRDNGLSIDALSHRMTLDMGIAIVTTTDQVWSYPWI